MVTFAERAGWGKVPEPVTICGRTAHEYAVVVQIDDGNEVKDYVLDEQGNATINGEIVFTKEQLESAENGDDNSDLNKDDIHTLISQVSGLELKDENGNPISFVCRRYKISKRSEIKINAK